MLKRLDIPSLSVIVITFFLFAFALFTEGMTHNLLLEAGVFLVSVKLILMNYKSGIAHEQLNQKLDRISSRLESLTCEETITSEEASRYEVQNRSLRP